MVKAFSAPGKALLAGGYLVLDPKYDSYVTALSSRMHAIAQDTQDSNLNELNTIIIRSPQFENGQWQYHLKNGDFSSIIELNNLQNPFIEATIQTVFSYLNIRSFPPIAVDIYSDSGYHTQENTIEKKSTNGKSFLYHNLPINEVPKTGMGSSAGLVVVLTSALLSYFINSVEKNENLVHNLSQIAHCLAQKKIGSGFDVAAAVFGSITYQRFDPKVIETLINHEIHGNNNLEIHDLSNSIELNQSYSANVKHIAESVWKFKHQPNALPPYIQLLMGDISGGSNTPKLVSKVLKWKSENPIKGEELFNNLNKSNQNFIESIQHLNLYAKANSVSYSKALLKLSKIDLNTLVLHTDEISDISKSILDPIGKLIKSFHNIRQYLKQLTIESGADIEPDSQTELLNHCNLIKGCFGGVVPGAGGYDAISVLVNKLNLVDFIETTGKDPRFENVTWLSLNEEGKGLIAENFENYNDIK